MESKTVALITGANSGFGLACTHALSEREVKVYASYRNPRKAGELWRLSRSLPVHPILMDVNRSPSVQRAIAQILKHEGKIDILLNNAGFAMAGFWEDLSDKDIRDQFETNVFGLLRVTRAVLPSMRKQGSGKIINIGSVAGFAATPGLGVYGATKFSVTSITEALRMEARPWGVEVAEISPGEIKTSVFQNARMGEWTHSPKSAYRPFTRQVEEMAKERFQYAAPVEKLVKAVLKALSQSPMKRRYLVKRDDYVSYYARWLFPDFLWERVIAGMFPWSRWQKK